MIVARVRMVAAERLPAGRVSADELLALLAAEADRTGDRELREVTKTLLRQWKRRHLSRGPGYVPAEVVAYLARRGDRGRRRRDTPGSSELAR